MSHKHEIYKDQTTVASTTKETTVVSQAPTLKERRVHDTVVKETIKPTQTEEVQPIVHRDIYTTEIHQQRQPVYQKEVLPTKVEEHVLPAQNLKEVNKGATSEHFSMDREKSTKVVENTTQTKIVKPTIVEEVIHPQVITEVQPVIYREVVQPTLIKEVQNINEKIVERPVIFTEKDSLPAGSLPAAPTADLYLSHPSHEHTSLRTKLHNLFHAPSAVDTIKPLTSTTVYEDSGSVTQPIYSNAPATYENTNITKSTTTTHSNSNSYV